MKGISLDKIEQYEEALQALDKAIQLYPHLPETHHSRGIVLTHLGRCEEAISSMQMALRLNPNFHRANREIDLFTSMGGNRKR